MPLNVFIVSLLKKEKSHSIGLLLNTNPEMKQLDTLWVEIGADGAKTLTSALKTNTTLQELDYNDISSDIKKTITKALERNKQLAEEKQRQNSEVSATLDEASRSATQQSSRGIS